SLWGATLRRVNRRERDRERRVVDRRRTRLAVLVRRGTRSVSTPLRAPHPTLRAKRPSLWGATRFGARSTGARPGATRRRSSPNEARGRRASEHAIGLDGAARALRAKRPSLWGATRFGT